MRGRSGYSDLIELAAENIREVDQIHGDLLDDLTSYMDAQYQVLRIAERTLGNGELGGRGQAETILFSALHKNMFVFFSTIELARRGLYGPGCTLLRSIVESLVLAKFCTRADNPTVLKKWLAGDAVHLVHDVLNRVSQPSFAETRVIWKDLNRMAHATIYAQQVSSRLAEIKKEVRATLGLTHVLLHWNYHLLARHFLTPSTIYYSRTYGDAKGLEDARRRARGIATKARKELTKEGARLVREYCSTWEISGRHVAT